MPRVLGVALSILVGTLSLPDALAAPRTPQLSERGTSAYDLYISSLKMRIKSTHSPRRLQLNAACTPPVPVHGHIGDCPARMASGSTCRPKCDQGYELKVDDKNAIIDTACKDGKITVEAECTRVSACVGPCISRETFENVSTTTWVIIFIVLGACCAGCFYLFYQMGYFERQSGGAAWEARNADDAVRQEQVRQYAQKKEAAERKKRGLSHLDDE